MGFIPNKASGIGGTLTKALPPVAVTLTDAATITLNASLGNLFTVTLGGNRTLASPTNPVDGQQIRIRVIQPALGGPWTLSYGGAYAFTTQVPNPTLSTGASAVDELEFEYSAGLAKWVLMASLIGVSAGGGTITNGSQLIGMFTGAPSSALNMSTNTGPNALLASVSYPLPSAAGPGPLTHVPLPGGFTYWRVDDGTSGQFTMPSLWASGPTTPYVGSNSAANLGGIIGVGGATIDGYVYPAGTYVFQFMDFSQGAGAIYFTNGPPVVFRGCRFRFAQTAPGFFNVSSSFTNTSAFHYCDLGAIASADADNVEVAIDIAYGTFFRAYRNYISYVATGIQSPNQKPCDITENFIEKLTLFYGASGPPGEGGTLHLNGITLNGGQPNALVLRNHIVIVTPDEASHAIAQTDCISFFQDFGTFGGGGTNADGSTGYKVASNYCGGTGYCYYFGQNAGTMPNTVNNMQALNNQVTTSSYSTGGNFGPATAIPTWGSFGNTQSGNVWADGASVGTSFL